MNVRRTLAALLLLAVLSPGTLTSCGLFDKLGFDTYDYMSETVTKTHDASGETAVMLEDLLGILITDSPVLPTFENMGTAIDAYRDAVLENLLLSDYAKYSGNAALIERATKKYPEYQITQIVPEMEFEATMYRCFGGDVMITHEDGHKYRYLPGVEAYIPMMAPVDAELSAEITYLAETDKTYRIRFKVTSEKENIPDSAEYFALVIKREDGTLYIKKLLNGGTVKN